MFVRKGVTPIIATILLILLAIVLIGILSFFNPYIKETLFGKEDCFEIINDMNFEDSLYNCEVTTGPKNRTSFAVRIDNPTILGFKLIMENKGASNDIDIRQGTTSNKLRMLYGDFNQPLEVNNEGGVRIYVAEGNYDTLEIAPILKDKICSETRKSLSDFNRCLDSGIYNSVVNDTLGGGTTNPGLDCVLTSASWSQNEAIEGESVILIVEGENCEGEELSFEIREDDSLGLGNFDDAQPITLNSPPQNMIFGETQARKVWVTEWHLDTGNIFGNNDPEYLFRAKLVSNPSEFKDSTSELMVTKAGPICGDNLIESPEVCDPLGSTMSCTSGGYFGIRTCGNSCLIWSACVTSASCGDGICQDPPENTENCMQDCPFTGAFCGNNIIEAPEVCDGNSRSCLNSGGYPGTETCNPSCSGWGQCVSNQFCGDGIKNGNEQCDGSAFGSTQCPASTPHGSLICRLDCTIDYSGCSNVGTGTSIPGTSSGTGSGGGSGTTGGGDS